MPDGELEQIEYKRIHDQLPAAIKKSFKFLPESVQAKYGNAVDTGFIQMQDRMLSIGQLVDRIKRYGGIVSTLDDPYIQSKLMHGKLDEALEDANRRFYTPLRDDIHKMQIKEATEADQLLEDMAPAGREVAEAVLQNYTNYDWAIAEMYLYALHALERNVEMARRNPGRPEFADGGSGITNQEANDILTALGKQKRYWDKLNDLNDETSVRSRMRALIKHTNDVRVKAGLQPDFREMVDPDTGLPIDPYQDYVPLRGFMDETGDPDLHTERFATAMGGFKIAGKEDKSATGRRSLAAHALEVAVKQNEESLVRVARNEVGQAFLRLVREHGDKMIGGEDGYGNPILDAEVIPATQKMWYYHSPSGTVRASQRQARIDPDVLVVKEDGKEVHIKIRNERWKKALIDSPDLLRSQLGPILKGLLGLNRFLAAVRTSYNLEFIPGNFSRDFQTAMVNLGEHEASRYEGRSSRTFPRRRGASTRHWQRETTVRSGLTPSSMSSASTVV